MTIQFTTKMISVLKSVKQTEAVKNEMKRLTLLLNN